MKFKIGDKIWVRDVVKSTVSSEPSVLPENGVWRDSRDIRLVRPRTEKYTIQEFYDFAAKVAKSGQWHIGGFLGEVWEQWHERQS